MALMDASTHKQGTTTGSSPELAEKLQSTDAKTVSSKERVECVQC